MKDDQLESSSQGHKSAHRHGAISQASNWELRQDLRSEPRRQFAGRVCEVQQVSARSQRRARYRLTPDAHPKLTCNSPRPLNRSHIRRRPTLIPFLLLPEVLLPCPEHPLLGPTHERTASNKQLVTAELDSLQRCQSRAGGQDPHEWMAHAFCFGFHPGPVCIKVERILPPGAVTCTQFTGEFAGAIEGSLDECRIDLLSSVEVEGRPSR